MRPDMLSNSSFAQMPRLIIHNTFCRISENLHHASWSSVIFSNYNGEIWPTCLYSIASGVLGAKAWLA